jgi:hypothetical protein
MAIIPFLNRRPGLIVVTLATVIALVSARSSVGGWNDGSRLATVESLVDHGTLAIDRSIFTPLTCDKLFINGRFYSDKSPVPAVGMAGCYWIIQKLTGLTAATNPQRFYWTMTLCSSGFAFVVAVFGIWRLSRRLDLPWTRSVMLTASFAVGTLALPYCCQVNNHILLLAVATLLVYFQIALALDETRAWWTFAVIGALTGLGYSIDLGIGPPLIAATSGLALVRSAPGSLWKRLGRLTTFGVGLIPFVALHHGLNFAVGGSIGPANAVPEYLFWPGSPFTAGNMTGKVQHQSAVAFLGYLFDLSFGIRGIVGHNPTLFLAVLPIGLLIWRVPRWRPEILAGWSWCLGSVLLYGITSNNHSGLNASVRWFVPFLAPAYFVLALSLKHVSHCLAEFSILALSGAAMAVIMWYRGPWQPIWLTGYWILLACGLVSWGYIAFRRQRTYLTMNDGNSHAAVQVSRIRLNFPDTVANNIKTGPPSETPWREHHVPTQEDR